MNETTHIKVDKHDLKLMFEALCYFDMYEDGNYEEWFGKDEHHANESFHYLYDTIRDRLDDI